MPTRRMIDPAIWQSETFAAFTYRQRLLFIGLFSNADDQGRLRAHPALIRSTVFPYEDIELNEVMTDLQALVSADCVYLFEMDNKPCLQIINWWRYQSPQWAYPSKIPAPEGWHDRLRYRQDNKIITDNWPTRENPEVLPNDLPNDLPNAEANALDCSHSTSVSSRVSNSDSVSDGADAPHTPTCLDDWLGWLEKTKNHPALVQRMMKELYRNKDPPTFGHIGKAAKRLGRGRNGYERLMRWIWRVASNPPDGDVLPYVEVVAKSNGKERPNGAHQPARTIPRVTFTDKDVPPDPVSVGADVAGVGDVPGGGGMPSGP